MNDIERFGMFCMAKKMLPDQTLLAENAELRVRLEAAEETLRAIGAGEVDALVVEGAAGPQPFTLQGLAAGQKCASGEMLAQVSDAVIVLAAHVMSGDRAQR
ncbi:MAG: hypothetical protein ABI684_05005 [Nitrospirota bacterium]